MLFLKIFVSGYQFLKVEVILGYKQLKLESKTLLITMQTTIAKILLHYKSMAKLLVLTLFQHNTKKLHASFLHFLWFGVIFVIFQATS